MTPVEITIEQLRPALVLLDFAGVAVFALTGALAAARAKQTIITFAFFAAITGIDDGAFCRETPTLTVRQDFVEVLDFGWKGYCNHSRFSLWRYEHFDSACSLLLGL